MGQTIVEKITQAHMTSGPKRPLMAGDIVAVRPDHVMTHDNTSPVIKKFKGIGAEKIFDPRQPVFALDHDIQNTTEDNLEKYRGIEAFAKEHGIDFFPAGSGIGHQIMCEQLYVVPECLVVASDSHSNTYGALGALGTPVVRTDAAAIWSTGEFWWQVPATIQVVLEGRLPEGSSGKDLIIALTGRYNHDEVLNAAIELTGSGVASLSMDARMTVANMSTEWGTLTAWFPIDAVTIEFLRARRAALGDVGAKRLAADSLERMTKKPLLPDKDAAYAGRITLDLASVTPQIAGPDQVQKTASLAEVAGRKIKINKAYLLSCVNSRLSDLAAAAQVLRGKKIAPGVTLYLAAASREIEEKAKAEGIWQTLVDAGATTLPSSCGPCIGLGTGLLEPGEVGISATNRNFKGRMGSRDAQCYLASPQVVAASALTGFISGPTGGRSTEIKTQWQSLKLPEPASEKVEILAGFPAQIRGRLVFVPQDNLNTDGIYSKDYTYRDDVTPEMMAEVVMENYDPQFSARTRAGDVLVGGFNFGTGSSREQAATALKAKGIALVIAGSFSQTYLRNAYNNGYACIECPTLVQHLKKACAEAIGKGERTIISEAAIEIDFTSGKITHAGATFRFPTLGAVPQALVVSGGVENQVRKVLGL